MRGKPYGVSLPSAATIESTRVGECPWGGLAPHACPKHWSTSQGCGDNEVKRSSSVPICEDRWHFRAYAQRRTSRVGDSALRSANLLCNGFGTEILEGERLPFPRTIGLRNMPHAERRATTPSSDPREETALTGTADSYHDVSIIIQSSAPWLSTYHLGPRPR